MSLKKLPLFVLSACCIANSGFSQRHKTQTRIFFKTDSSTVSHEEYVKLKGLMNHPDTLEIAHISVVASCDDVGSKAYNQALSVKRAQEVKNLLIALSVPESMIETTGNGEIALRGGKAMEEERASNRLAAVNLTYTIKPKQVPAGQPEEKLPAKVEKASAGGPLSDNQKVGDKITLQNILFIGGRHVLLPESYEALEKLTATLLEKKKYHIMILGHICCQHDGNDGTDFDTGIANLSVARAKAIYDYLIAHGVAAERLRYAGLKNDYPTGLGDRQDRRVEIQITKIVGE